MSLAKQMFCSCILSDIRFAKLLWCTINLINIDHLWLAFGQTSAIANVHCNRDQLFSWWCSTRCYGCITDRLSCWWWGWSGGGWCLPLELLWQDKSHFWYLYLTLSVWNYAIWLCIFFGNRIKNKNNYIPFTAVCTSINNGGISGSRNFVRYSFLFLNQIAVLGRFLVIKALTDIIVTGMC